MVVHVAAFIVTVAACLLAGMEWPRKGSEEDERDK